MTKMFFYFLILFFLFSCCSYIAHAEEIITIVPGSSDSSRYRFFDITEYPISTGEEIKWYNADNILHNIQIISNDTDKPIVAESENIEPKGYFNYEFKEEGEYLFHSIKYPWMKGKIIVTEDIKTITERLKNNIDLYISWTPSVIKSGENTLFKIILLFYGTGRISIPNAPITKVPISIQVMNNTLGIINIDSNKIDNHFGNDPLYSIPRRG